MATLVEAHSSTLITSASKDGLHDFCLWSPDGVDLMVLMFKEPDTMLAMLDVHKLADKNKRIASLTLDSSPFLITQFGGKLVVLCQTATGYLVYAFAYNNGLIEKIINDGSNLQPELIYFGPSIDAAISVPILGWVGGKRLPVTTNIYFLQGEKAVPWNERFGAGK
jgi:hypothetical protein